MRLVNFYKITELRIAVETVHSTCIFLFTHSQQVPKSQNQPFVESFCVCEMMMSCLTKQQWKILFKQELKALHCHLWTRQLRMMNLNQTSVGEQLYFWTAFIGVCLYLLYQLQAKTNCLRHNELQEEVHMPCYLWPRFSYPIFKFFQTRPSSTRSVLQSTSCTTLSTEISGYTDPSEAVHATRIFEWVGQRNGITDDRGCWIGYAFGFGKVWVFVGGGCWWFR